MKTPMLDLNRDPRALEVYERLTAPPQFLRGPAAGSGSSEDVVIDESWEISDPVNSEMTGAAVESLRLFLKDALKVSLKGGGKAVRIVLSAANGPKGAHTLIVDAAGIEVRANSEWGVAAGLYHLQRSLKLRGRPAITRGTRAATPVLDPALVCLAFKTSSIDRLDFPEAYHDNYLARIALAGYSGFHINLALDIFVQSDVFPELNHGDAASNLAQLNQIVALARKRALDVFLSIYMHPFPPEHPLFKRCPAVRGSRLVTNPRLCNLCSSSAEVVAFYCEQFSQLFRHVPALAGVILITGCEGLLHCYTAPLPEEGKQTNCVNCAVLNPERVVADMCNAIAAAVKEAAPAARCIFWTYKQHVWTAPAGEAFIRGLSPDCELMANFDTDAAFELNGVRGEYFDYSLSCVGPSPVFQVQAACAKEKALNVLAKVENGVPLEFYSVPFVPALTRWGRKYANILCSGATGAMFNWQFVGYTESLSAELAGWMSWTLDRPWEEILQAMAARDFGAANVRQAMSAWSLFDRAMAFHPFSIHTAGYFKGPFYIGFAQPLIFDPLKLDGLEDHFWFSSSSIVSEATRKPLFVVDLSWTQPFGAVACRRALKKMESLWSRGCAQLESMKVPRDDMYAEKNIIEHGALARGMLCMIRTALNMIEFFRIRDRIFHAPATLESYKSDLQRLQEIACRELENAEAGLACMQNNPLLGFDYIYHYAFTQTMCVSKIAHTRKLIEHDIPFLLYSRGCSSNVSPEWFI